MQALDLFFKMAVPFAILCVIVASVAVSYNRRFGVYDSASGAARRDAINRDYGTMRGAKVIAGIFVMLWGLTCAALVESAGLSAFAIVIGALITIPFMAVCTGVIMIYMFAVHGYANLKARSGQ